MRRFDSQGPMELGKKFKQGQAVVLTLGGRIRMADTEALEQALQELIRSAGDDRRFVLDLSNVSYICSSALGALIALKRQILKMDGEIRLVVAPGDVMDLLRLTMVDKVFPIHAGLTDAVSAFGD